MTEQQASGSQADSSEAQSQVDASTDTSEASQAQSSEPQSIEELPSWVQKEIKSLRNENAKARKERQQREEQEKTALQLEETRRQAAEEERDSFRTELRRYRFSEAIQLPNKQYAWLAAQQYGIEIDFDDSNRPTNADKVAKELAKRDPALFGAGKADAGERGAESVNGSAPANELLSILTRR